MRYGATVGDASSPQALGNERAQFGVFPHRVPGQELIPGGGKPPVLTPLVGSHLPWPS